MNKPAPTVDGFFWTRVTAKLLRFLYEPVALEPLPSAIREQVGSATTGAEPNNPHTPASENDL